MTLPSLLRLTLTTALLLGSISCASSTKLTEAWKSPQTPSAPYKKILVVGIARNDARRHMFEDHLTAALAKLGIEGVPSYTLLPDPETIKRETVVAAIEGKGFDGGIATRLIKVDKKLEARQDRYAAAPPVGYYNNFYGYYGSAWTVVRTSTYVEEYDIVTLETNLYDVASEALIWSGRTESFGPDSVEQVVGELTDVLISELVAQKLIVPSSSK